MRKHGIEQFVIECVENDIDASELDDRERFWISELNATNQSIGYNLKAGGRVYREPKHPEEIRRAMSESRKLWWADCANKSHMSKIMRRRWKDPEYQKARSESVKRDWEDVEKRDVRIRNMKKFFADNPDVWAGKQSGTKSACAKLTADEVRAIRRLREEGKTYDSIGRRFGVAPSTIYRVVKRQRYKNVD